MKKILFTAALFSTLSFATPVQVLVTPEGGANWEADLSRGPVVVFLPQSIDLVCSVLEPHEVDYGCSMNGITEDGVQRHFHVEREQAQIFKAEIEKIRKSNEGVTFQRSGKKVELKSTGRAFMSTTEKLAEMQKKLDQCGCGENSGKSAPQKKH